MDISDRDGTGLGAYARSDGRLKDLPHLPHLQAFWSLP